MSNPNPTPQALFARLHDVLDGDETIERIHIQVSRDPEKKECLQVFLRPFDKDGRAPFAPIRATDKPDILDADLPKFLGKAAHRGLTLAQADKEATKLFDEAKKLAEARKAEAKKKKKSETRRYTAAKSTKTGSLFANGKSANGGASAVAKAKEVAKAKTEEVSA